METLNTAADAEYSLGADHRAAELGERRFLFNLLINLAGFVGGKTWNDAIADAQEDLAATRARIAKASAETP